MEIHRVGIVGAGTMGSRIAFQCAICGRKVTLFDASPDALKRAMAQLRDWFLERVPSDEVENILSRVRPCTKLGECVTDTDLVIETVPENLDLKREVFAEVDRLAPAHVLIATNSSSLPSSRLASATRRPDKVFNVNFCDPVHGELLVEMMGHPGVSEETMAAGEEFLRSIKTVPIVTKKEIMGFAFNRVWRAIKREVLHLVGDGYTDFEDIDRAWILSWGTRQGPFGLMDEIGLDVVRDIEVQYFLDSGEERDRPPEFLDNLISRGRLGVKTGRGFYRYPDPEFLQDGWMKKELPWTPDRVIAI